MLNIALKPESYWAKIECVGSDIDNMMFLIDDADDKIPLMLIDDIDYKKLIDDMLYAPTMLEISRIKNGSKEREANIEAHYLAISSNPAYLKQYLYWLTRNRHYAKFLDFKRPAYVNDKLMEMIEPYIRKHDLPVFVEIKIPITEM